VVSRFNRLLTFGSPDRTWCCERCRTAAFAAEHTVAWKHTLHAGKPYSDLPELEPKSTDKLIPSLHPIQE